MQYISSYISPVGNLKIVCNEKYLLQISFIADQIQYNDCTPLILRTKLWLDAYFKGENPALENIPFNPQGTEFQKRVWWELLKIPYGKTKTYGEIAKIIAQKSSKGKMSAQAIGQAVGANPIAIIIPCHRVIGSKGNLTGYAYGLPAKIKLLQIEKHCIRQKNNYYFSVI